MKTPIKLGDKMRTAAGFNSSSPADMRAFDQKMLAFYRARVAAGSPDPVGDTEKQFGEKADWCVKPVPFTYSDGVTE